MAAEYTGRIPKMGDRVGAIGHTGAFEVVAVDEVHRAVSIKLLGSSHTKHGVPWTTLVFDAVAGHPTNQTL